ncbi:MAG: Ig-like domain-containing protein [Myxococcota bacterium]
MRDRLRLFGLMLLLPLSVTLACDNGETESPADAADAADAAADTDASTDTASHDALEDAGPDSGEQLGPYPEPDDWPQNHGPGGPTVSFSESDLYKNCATLDGGENDQDHHNLVVMYDGYLVMPWAHEAGGLLAGEVGGLTFFDISDPCNPEVAGTNESEFMRESHSIGFAHIDGRRWAVVNQSEGLRTGGIQFWDITDPTAPEPVSRVNVDGYLYPDAYARIVFSVFWQGEYVYAAGSENGIYVIDASDPANPSVAAQYNVEPVVQLGQVQVIGNLLTATTSEGSRTVLLDVSDPTRPQPIPGGDFQIRDEEGTPREAYFSNTTNGYIYYARKEGGGGLFIYDITDPTNPTKAGDYLSDGNGGYVFVKDDHAVTGESRFAVIYDISDLENISEVARLDLVGDLDTATPIGNVIVLSVDDDAVPNEASKVAPYLTEPDTTAPHVTWAWPNDGADDLPLTSRVGVTFNEMVDVKSAWRGSVRLYVDGEDPDETQVPGYINTQETIVNFTPKEPLEPNTTYRLEIPAGGIVDYNGNPVEESFTMTFTTLGG